MKKILCILLISTNIIEIICAGENDAEVSSKYDKDKEQNPSNSKELPTKLISNPTALMHLDGMLPEGWFTNVLNSTNKENISHSISARNQQIMHHNSPMKVPTSAKAGNLVASGEDLSKKDRGKRKLDENLEKSSSNHKSITSPKDADLHLDNISEADYEWLANWLGSIYDENIQNSTSSQQNSPNNNALNNQPMEQNSMNNIQPIKGGSFSNPIILEEEMEMNPTNVVSKHRRMQMQSEKSITCKWHKCNGKKYENSSYCHYHEQSHQYLIKLKDSLKKIQQKLMDLRKEDCKIIQKKALSMENVKEKINCLIHASNQISQLEDQKRQILQKILEKMIN